MFQLVAINLPQSGEQVVDAKEMSAVLGDVSSDPAATAIGREVCSLQLYTTDCSEITLIHLLFYDHVMDNAWKEGY